MLQTMFDDYSSNSIYYGLLVLLLSCFIVSYLPAMFRQSLPENAPRMVRENYPIVGAIGFFTRRFDFMMSGKHQTQSQNFSFFLGKNQVVGLTGEKGREVFFESKQLDFAEGYKVMFGLAPRVPDTVKAGSQTTDPEAVATKSGSLFNKRIIRMVHRDTLINVLPKILNDTKLGIEKMGKSGVIRPFDSIYKLIFQLTLRIVATDDIANNPELLNDTLSYYETIENSSTATGIVFPWLPTPTAAKRTYAGARLYMIFKKIIDERVATGKKGDDPLQYMLDMGDSTIQIIEFVIGALFAGLINSGINASYVLCYLASDPYWNAAARKEIAEVTARYSRDTSRSLLEQLGDIPFDAWEGSFPTLDLCLKDSIRLHLHGTGFRRNTSGKDIVIGEEVIPNGAFTVYHLGDTHMDPKIFENPDMWDPSRYLPARAEDKKLKKYAWNGWGAGRHPCLGMRFAKLEQNIIMAHYLTAFDMQVVDSKGQPALPPPAPDKNNQTARKPKLPVFLKYKARV